MATNIQEDVVLQYTFQRSFFSTTNLNQDNYSYCTEVRETENFEDKKKNNGPKKKKCGRPPLGPKNQKRMCASQRRRKTAVSALIDNNLLLQGAKVYYRNGKKGSIAASGKLTRNGVECCCCQNLFNLTNFEVHAGSTYHRPAANIFLENGMSLQDCQAQLKSNDSGVTERVKLSEKRSTDKKVCGVILDTVNYDDSVSKTRDTCDNMVFDIGNTDDMILDTGSNDEKLSETHGTHGDDVISGTDNNDRKLTEIHDTHDDGLLDPGSSHNEFSEICDIDDDVIADTRNNNEGLLEVLDINDNICTICGEAGELVLCDQCPASFHLSCLGLTMVPEGKLWYCPYCCCRVCGRICRVIDEESTEQCTDNDSVVNCGQCEKRYHVLCVKKDNFMDCSNREGKWFCNQGCEKIFFGLQEVLGKQVKVQGHNNLTWTLLQNCDNITPESHKKLKAALSVMHQCFKPSKEYRTRRDINEIIIFNKGSELNLRYLRGFYTVVLERGGKVSTVAVVRVHGEKVAEISLVATRPKYRRQGQCRILMDEIERKLAQLGVERIVLPSAVSVLEMWRKSFGFCPMSEAERLNFLGFNFLNFHGTIMCQKSLRKNEDFEHHKEFRVC